MQNKLIRLIKNNNDYSLEIVSFSKVADRYLISKTLKVLNTPTSKILAFTEIFLNKEYEFTFKDNTYTLNVNGKDFIFIEANKNNTAPMYCKTGIYKNKVIYYIKQKPSGEQNGNS